MPPAHAFVYTNDKQKIGKVYNVFGPVKNPYIAVSLFKSVNRRDLESRTGEKVYASTKKELEKSKAKNSKNRKKSKNKSFKNKNSKDKRSKSNKRKNKSKRFNQKNKR
jgi:RNA-binding protein